MSTNPNNSEVIALTRSSARRAKALELGADVAIDSTDAAAVAPSVREATEGNGADIIFECKKKRIFSVSS